MDVADLLAQPSVSFGALKSADAEDRALPAQQDGDASPAATTRQTTRPIAKMAMLAATLLCLSTKGDGYLPDCTCRCAAPRRRASASAVIAVEDSWFLNSAPHDRGPLAVAARALSGLAMATMRMPDYHISAATATKVGRLATHVVASRHLLAWTPKFTRERPRAGGGHAGAHDPLGRAAADPQELRGRHADGGAVRTSSSVPMARMPVIDDGTRTWCTPTRCRCCT